MQNNLRNYAKIFASLHTHPKQMVCNAHTTFHAVTTIFVTILIMPLHYAIIAICGMAMNQLRVENGL